MRIKSQTPRSLSSELVTSITALLVAILLLGGALTYMRAVSKVSTEMRAAVAVGARVAHNAVDDVEERTDPGRRLSLLVADFDGDRHLRAIHRGPDGNVVAMSRIEAPEAGVPPWFQKLFGGEPIVAPVPLPKVFEGLGTLTFETDSHNEVAELWTEVVLMLGLLASFCVLTLILVRRVIRRAVRPLDGLSAALVSIGRGERVAPMGEQGPLELVRIYRGFNDMVEQLRGSEQRSQMLAEQLNTVQEEERADIARDLHDEIGPFLFSVDVDAATIERTVEQGNYDAIPPRVAMIRSSVRHMREHVKGILRRLRQGELTDLGLSEAVSGLVAFWRSRQSGVVIAATIPAEGFGPRLDDTVYRVIQESLSNAIRHGQPKSVSIAAECSRQGRVVVTITDDGCGLKSEFGRSGFGIAGMRERVVSLGGTLLVQNRAGIGGTIVTASMPLEGGMLVPAREREAA